MSNVKKNHEDLLKSGQIKLVVGDGRQGHAQNGPYHAIHVGAAAPSLPQAVSLLHAIASHGPLLLDRSFCLPLFAKVWIS